MQPQTQGDDPRAAAGQGRDPQPSLGQTVSKRPVARELTGQVRIVAGQPGSDLVELASVMRAQRYDRTPTEEGAGIGAWTLRPRVARVQRTQARRQLMRRRAAGRDTAVS